MYMAQSLCQSQISVPQNKRTQILCRGTNFCSIEQSSVTGTNERCYVSIYVRINFNILETSMSSTVPKNKVIVLRTKFVSQHKICSMAQNLFRGTKSVSRHKICAATQTLFSRTKAISIDKIPNSMLRVRSF